MHQGNTCREINQVLIKSNTEKDPGMRNDNELDVQKCLIHIPGFFIHITYQSY